MEIRETKNFAFVESLAKSFGMNVHPFDNCLKAWEAIEDGKPVGSVILRGSGNEYKLDLLAVDKKHQNKGIGTKLMNKVIETAKKLGAQRIFLITRHARGFYEAAGFRKIGEDEFPQPLFVCLHCKRKEECAPDLMVKQLN
ncbi:MAG: GNAT family N-acetyltransferase [Candidatus Micrarchaeia archaeon]